MKLLLKAAALLLFFLPGTVRAQPGSSFFAQSSVQATEIFGQSALLVGGQVGLARGEHFSVGLRAMGATRNLAASTAAAYERVEGLFYVGPQVEYRRVLRGPVGAYAGLTGAVGFGNYERGELDVIATRHGPYFLLEPEVGLSLHVAGLLHLRVGTGGLLGTGRTGSALTSGPSLNVGLRVGG